MSSISLCTVNHPQFKYPHENVVWSDLEIVSCVIKVCYEVILLTEYSCPHGGAGAHVLVFVPPQLMLQRESGRAQAVQPPPTPSLFLYPPILSLPPSHLIAFDKCPYWLHIIRCGRGSLRLYYSAHIPHLFSILHGWHTCFYKVRTGPGLCQWNSFMSRRFHRRREILVSALDMASSVTANLFKGVEKAQERESCSHKL